MLRWAIWIAQLKSRCKRWGFRNNVLLFPLCVLLYNCSTHYNYDRWQLLKTSMLIIHVRKYQRLTVTNKIQNLFSCDTPSLNIKYMYQIYMCLWATCIIVICAVTCMLSFFLNNYWPYSYNHFMLLFVPYFIQ